MGSYGYVTYLCGLRSKSCCSSYGDELEKDDVRISFCACTISVLLHNEFYVARKDKIDPFVEEGYNDSLTMEFEKESLGTYITVKPWWDEVAVNQKLTFRGGIRKLNERADKRGRLMAFPELVSNGCEISALMFSSAYAKVAIEVSNNYLRQAEVEFEFTGKKDEKGKFIINGIKTIAKEIFEDEVEEIGA